MRSMGGSVTYIRKFFIIKYCRHSPRPPRHHRPPRRPPLRLRRPRPLGRPSRTFWCIRCCHRHRPKRGPRPRPLGRLLIGHPLRHLRLQARRPRPPRPRQKRKMLQNRFCWHISLFMIYL